MTKPVVKLVGEDGNVFAILGRCLRAARRAGWDQVQIDAFMKNAQGGDYDHALQVVLREFDVR